MNKSRLEAFSDGVFAISITLLVLDIRIPPFHSLNDDQLTNYLIKALPHILTFLFTFLVVGVFWVAHHRTLFFVKLVDATLLWMNIFYLMIAAIIPFPASILATHQFLPSAIRLYTATLCAFGLMHFVFLFYIGSRPKLQAFPVSKAMMRSAIG